MSVQGRQPFTAPGTSRTVARVHEAPACWSGALEEAAAERRDVGSAAGPQELAAFERYVRRDMVRLNELNRTGRAKWSDFVEPLERHMAALREVRLRGPQTLLAHVLVNFATRSLVRWGLRQSGLPSHAVVAAVPSLVTLLTELDRRRGMPERDQCFQTHALDNAWLYWQGFTAGVVTNTHLPGEALFILTLATGSGHAKQARAALLPILDGRLEPASPPALARLETAVQRMSSFRTAMQALISQMPVESFQEFRQYHADAVALRPGGRAFGGSSGADDPYLLALDLIVYAPLPAWYEEGYLPERLACLSLGDRRRYEAERRRPSLLELAIRHRGERAFVEGVLGFVKRYNAAMGVHWRSVVHYLLDPPGAVDRGTAQVLVETVKLLLDMRRGDPRIKELAEVVRSDGGTSLR